MAHSVPAFRILQGCSFKKPRAQKLFVGLKEVGLKEERVPGRLGAMHCRVPASTKAGVVAGDFNPLRAKTYYISLRLQLPK